MNVHGKLRPNRKHFVPQNLYLNCEFYSEAWNHAPFSQSHQGCIILSDNRKHRLGNLRDPGFLSGVFGNFPIIEFKIFPVATAGQSVKGKIHCVCHPRLDLVLLHTYMQMPGDMIGYQHKISTTGTRTNLTALVQWYHHNYELAPLWQQ